MCTRTEGCLDQRTAVLFGRPTSDPFRAAHTGASCHAEPALLEFCRQRRKKKKNVYVCVYKKGTHRHIISTCLFYCWRKKVAISLYKNTNDSDLSKNSSKLVIFRSITLSLNGLCCVASASIKLPPCLECHVPCRPRLVLKGELRSELEHKLESLTKPNPHTKLFRFISLLSFATTHFSIATEACWSAWLNIYAGVLFALLRLRCWLC